MNIQATEEEIMGLFKTIIINDQDGLACSFPVTYSTEDKLWQAGINLGEKPKFPIMGLTSTRFGCNWLCMEGFFLTKYRKEYNQIVEQIYQKIIGFPIKIEEIICGSREYYLPGNNGHSLLTGKFQLRYDQV